MKESESMTERMPLGFDFNKQFKSQNLDHVKDTFILLGQYLFCQSRSLCGFSKPVSIHQTNTTNFSFLLQNGCSQTVNKYRPKLVGIVFQIPIMSKDFCYKQGVIRDYSYYSLIFDRSCALHMWWQTTTNCMGSELNIYMHLFYHILVH